IAPSKSPPVGETFIYYIKPSLPGRVGWGLRLPYTMAIFIFFSAAAGTRIVSTNLILYPNRHGFLQLAHILHRCAIGLGNKLGLGGAHFSQVELWLRPCFPDLVGLLLYRYASPEQETHQLLVYGGQHPSEQFKGFKLINQQWVFLLVNRVLYRLF